MGYRPGSSVPDWESYLLSLREVLDDCIFRIEQDCDTGVGADVSYMEAMDILNQYVDSVKRDLGV